MSQDEIILQKNGPIATITLNNPKKRNAQGVSFTPNFMRVLDQVEDDPDVRCVILTGKGPVFWWWR